MSPCRKHGRLWQPAGSLELLWRALALSHTLASLVVHISERTGGPCRVPPAHVERTLDGKASPLCPCWLLLFCHSPRATLTMWQQPCPTLGALGPHSPPQGQDIDPLLHLQQPLRVSGQCHSMAVGSQEQRGQGSLGALPSSTAPPSRPCSPQDPMAPADRLSPLQVCVPWEEDVTFPVGEEQGQSD